MTYKLFKARNSKRTADLHKVIYPHVSVTMAVHFGLYCCLVVIDLIMTVNNFCSHSNGDNQIDTMRTSGGEVTHHRLVPNLKETVPRACCYSHTIFSNSQTADTIVMASKNACPFLFKCIPYIAVEIIVTSQ